MNIFYNLHTHSLNYENGDLVALLDRRISAVEAFKFQDQLRSPSYSLMEDALAKAENIISHGESENERLMYKIDSLEDKIIELEDQIERLERSSVTEFEYE